MILFLFLELHQLAQACFLWWDVEWLQLEAEHLGTKGLQQVEFMVAGSKAMGLYDILHVVMTWPDPLMSVVPPPKSCRWVPSPMVLHPSAQETKVAALGASEQGAPLPVPKPQGGDISIKMAPLHVNIGMPTGPIAARVRGAPRDPCLPVLPYVLMCTAPIWAQSCHVPSAPLCFLTPMPSNVMASGHISLGLQTQLKECYSSVYKKELCHSWTQM